MQFLIVANRQQVILGPIDWRQRYIQSEFNDLDIDYRVPMGEPPGYIAVNDSQGNPTGVEIFPVSLTEPPHDVRLFNLAGPFWNYEAELAVGYYDLVEKPLDEIKSKIKQTVAFIRYSKEVGGAQFTISEHNILLDTTRENRSKYLDLVNATENSAIDYKTELGFVQVDKATAQSIYNAVCSHVQAQFQWEKSLTDRIDAATTFTELELILDELKQAEPNLTLINSLDS